MMENIKIEREQNQERHMNEKEASGGDLTEDGIIVWIYKCRTIVGCGK